MSESLRPRAFVTGCGALSPLGEGVPAFWEGLLEGRSGLRAIDSFPPAGHLHPMAGEVPDFDSDRHFTPAEAARLDRLSQFAMVAVREALADAAVDLARIDRCRMGVVIATTLGGMRVGEEYLRGAAGFDLRRLLRVPYFALAATVARELGSRGPVLSPSIACASGTHAVGLALELIRRGQGDLFVVGGAETVCSFVVSGFDCLRATTAEAVRPFDARRSGLLVGEGAAILVVESEEHARARGAVIDVEVAGSGLAGDAVHMTAPARDGAGAARAMRAALQDAAVDVRQLDFISAHGTGTVYNDAMEIAAIGAVLGEHRGRVPVNSIKGAIGHTLGAAGAFEAILCAQALRYGLIPPTVSCEILDPECDLDVVRGAARRAALRVVLSTSSAFAGNNAALVLRRAQ